eukprot:TRINITY_DN19384_c0_g1_i1.p1 TRINITY_DN19384_c0_g1~~TRINITY_DN19384_c0_g1_i1.p1  ORF type:complete len:360 (-),score=51.31 TRINITY_DN19384_c0_g1_i1:108-1187(-)
MKLALIGACVSIASAVDASLEPDLPPNMKLLQDLARDTPEKVLEHIKSSPFRAVVKEVQMPETGEASGSALPTVTAHGMGDSCWEPGFSSITRAIAKRTGSYAKCIPTGSNILTDTIYGYLMGMDRSVDIFAEKIRADENLKGGFNAIGFSQGNSLIRGYIQKYNDPPVNAFISVHGTVMGVGAFPACFSQGKPLGLLCKAFAELLGDLAYNKLVQGFLFQAGYFRDPKKVTSEGYLKNSEIAQWNNENNATRNLAYVTNFNKVKKFAMVKALQDTMVYPNQGEHWGALPDGTYGQPEDMKATKFYKDDLFGLKSADVAGKIAYETTPGGHLEFSDEQLLGWVDKYFVGKSSNGDSLLV